VLISASTFEKPLCFTPFGQTELSLEVVELEYFEHGLDDIHHMSFFGKCPVLSSTTF